MLLVGEALTPTELCIQQPNSDDRHARSHSAHREVPCKLNAHRSTVSLSDFDFVKVIGKGSFGTVSHIPLSFTHCIKSSFVLIVRYLHAVFALSS